MQTGVASMLQSNMLNDRTRVLDGVVQMEEGGIGGLLRLALGFLRRQYLLIAFAAVLGLAASISYLRIVPPTYTAQARLLFATPKAPFVQSTGSSETTVDAVQLESQIQVLKSKAIATSVINELKLANDPEFKVSDGRSHSIRRTIQEWLGISPSD